VKLRAPGTGVTGPPEAPITRTWPVVVLTKAMFAPFGDQVGSVVGDP